MLRKIGIVVAGILSTVAVVATALYLATMPEQPPQDSASLDWLQSGPYSVGHSELVLVDDSRATDANNEYPGASERSFPTRIWYPENATGSHPLILHSHGFLSSRREMSYVAEQLASHGYIVVAADYPLSSGSAPGGANANDVINQPADASFLIDSVLALSGQNKPFAGQIDTDRIGLMGLSLGGLTTSLSTYHPRLRDRRIKAAISIAGLSAMFTKQFYQSTDIPFLMIAGTADAIVDYASNAAVIPQRVRNSALLTIAGGSHLGFISISDPLFRFMHNPDALGCSAVLGNIDEDPNEWVYRLGTIEDGVYVDPDIPGVCAVMPLVKSIHPGRQQMITQIGVLSFFESVFATNADDRAAARNQLMINISADFQEASYTRYSASASSLTDAN